MRSNRHSGTNCNGRLLGLAVLVAIAIFPVGAEAKSKTTTKVTPKATKLSTSKARHHQIGGNKPTKTTVKVSSRVEGGSTGDGPNTDADCAELADDINHSLDEMEDALLDGDDAAASAWSGIANTVTDTGLDGGCFFTGVE